MKKLATTLFGLFLAVASFANVNGNDITLPTNETTFKAITQTESKTKMVLTQAMDLMTLSKKHKVKGPRSVVQDCHTKCEDDL